MASPMAAVRKLPGWLMAAAAASEPGWGEGERGKAGPNTPVKGRSKKGTKRSQNGAQGMNIASRHFCTQYGA